MVNESITFDGTTMMNTLVKRFSPAEELANALSHFTGALLATAGLVLMVVFSALNGNAWHIVSTSIFGFSMLILYTSSTFNHWLKPGKGKEFFFAGLYGRN